MSSGESRDPVDGGAAPAVDDLRVDGERLWETLMEMARIGATPEGGCQRLALTDEDRAALDLFADWVHAAGCSVTRDKVGNLFAERPGADPDLPPVLIGSHLDTQPNGGRFDGAYGTLAALEVLRTLDDHRIETRAPVVVVSWIHEEGARFPLPCTGSAVFAGALSLEEARAQRAVDGPTFGEELERVGMAGREEPGSRRFACFLEAHIEQGTVLERARATAGIVTRGQGVRGIELRFAGSDAHAGTTPMDARRDALVGAARIVGEVRALPQRHAGGLATVGVLEALPGSRPVVPGEARMVVDLRHPELETLERMKEDVVALAEASASAEGLELAVDTFLEIDPVVFAPECVEALRAAAETVGEPSLELVSRAGHDAFWVSPKMPTAMLFVPCRDGISHSPEEHVEPSDARAACDVLLHATLRQAGVHRRLDPARPLDRATAVAHLRSRGIFGEHEAVVAEELAGGVSSVVVLARGDERAVVVKQALPRLRVAREWRSDRWRTLIEADALLALGEITPTAVPRVVDVDRDLPALTMEALDTGTGSWKESLLAGDVDARVAQRLGEVLGRWHAATAADAGPRGPFDSREVFLELRVRPFFGTTAERHPGLRPALDALVERMLAQRRCLVHGDFSPKNVLVDADRVVVFDCEVAHVGDPAFDIGFLIHHLALKALACPADGEALERCSRTFLAAYREDGGLEVDPGHQARLTACLMLARVDGRSPVAYLDEAARARVRELARGALAGAAASTLDTLWDGVRDAAGGPR